MNIEQAREVSSRIWNAGYTDDSATIDGLIELIAQLEREMVAATLRIDDDAIELERISALADKWNFECDELREDNKRLDAELERIKGQQPVAWGIVASNTGRICQVELDAAEVEGHKQQYIRPLFLAAGATCKPPLQVHGDIEGAREALAIAIYEAVNDDTETRTPWTYLNPGEWEKWRRAANLAAGAQPVPVQAQEQGKWYAAEDIDRMVRELDVAMVGKNAAKQAMLCDLMPSLLATIKDAQERKPLTLGQIDELISVADQSWAGVDVPLQWAEHFVRAIEAKLKD